MSWGEICGGDFPGWNLPRWELLLKQQSLIFNSSLTMVFVSFSRTLMKWKILQKWYLHIPLLEKTNNKCGILLFREKYFRWISLLQSFCYQCCSFVSVIIWIKRALPKWNSYFLIKFPSFFMQISCFYWSFWSKYDAYHSL